MTFDEQLQAAGVYVVQARASYDILWLYNGRETFCDYVDATSEYYQFFLRDGNAHFELFIVCIDKLFEKKSDTINFYHLMKQSKPNDKIIGLMACARPITRKVAILRNNAIAHTNNTQSRDKWFEQAKALYRELRELSDVSLEIINELNADNGKDIIAFDEMAVEDCRAMLDTLGKHSRYDMD